MGRDMNGHFTYFPDINLVFLCQRCEDFFRNEINNGFDPEVLDQIKKMATKSRIRRFVKSKKPEIPVQCSFCLNEEHDIRFIYEGLIADSLDLMQIEFYVNNILPGIEAAKKAKEKKQLEEYGPELFQELQKWEPLCGTFQHFEFFFKAEEEIDSDIVMLEKASVENESVYLHVWFPKISKNELKKTIEWTRKELIDSSCIISCEPLPENVSIFDLDGHPSHILK
ncbi:MAG: hypothetical protein RBR08_15230 [Desulforegulaceae bacterium]|nr:hypothetical protein [Desulforegulaceae bacterium]